MPGVADEWHRLGDLVRDRRTFLGLTQDELAEAADMSPQTVRMIEGAKQEGYRALTYAGLERGLRWEAGSIRAVLSGGEPVAQDQPSPVRPRADRSDVEAAITNDPRLAEVAKNHLRNQYRMLLHVPEDALVGGDDEGVEPLRAVAYREGSTDELRNAQDQARRTREEHERTKRSTPRTPRKPM